MKCGLKNLTVRAMWQVRGGNEDGANLRSADYSVNSKNQYTSRDVPPYIEVQGIANVTATVTVEGSSSGVYRHGEYFRKELYDNNSSAPQYPTIDVDTDVTSPVSGEKYLPQDAESFGYDSDGNLTSDGRWTYTWDAENRLTKMERNVSSPSGARQKLEFEYDWQGRRIRKKFFTYSSGWQEQSDTIFLYDGWNLVAELDANNSNAKVRTYIWGLDLSGTEQGAGGVGGLLKETDYTSGTTHHFVAHDGNGNVVALVKATDGTYTARYEYGPFGESIRGSGTMSYNNPFRFSTKYTDNESGLVYYGYRYYNPSTGRWLSRDPIEEEGGLNVYAFVGNDTIRRIDLLGLADLTIMDSGITVISVGQCEIVVYLSHGNPNGSPRFLFPKRGCSAYAGAISCFADQVNTMILKTRNPDGTSHMIPGSPRNTDGDTTWQGEIDARNNQYDIANARAKMKREIVKLVNDMLKKCCKKSVKFTFFDVDKEAADQTFTTPITINSITIF